MDPSAFASYSAIGHSPSTPTAASESIFVAQPPPPVASGGSSPQSSTDVVSLRANREASVAYADRIRQLQLAKTSDLLKRKIERRPDRQSLVTRHILRDDRMGTSPFVLEQCRNLYQRSLRSQLDSKLAERPGSLELVERGVLQVAPGVDSLIRSGSIDYPRVCCAPTTPTQPTNGINFIPTHFPIPPAPSIPPPPLPNKQPKPPSSTSNYRRIRPSSICGTPPPSVSSKSVSSTASSSRSIKDDTVVYRLGSLIMHDYCPKKFSSTDATYSVTDSSDRSQPSSIASVDNKVGPSSRQKARLVQQAEMLRLEATAQAHQLVNSELLIGGNDGDYNQDLLVRPMDPVTSSETTVSSHQDSRSILASMLEQLNLSQLRVECRHRLLPRSGRKALLVQHLLPYAHELVEKYSLNNSASALNNPVADSNRCFQVANPSIQPFLSPATHSQLQAHHQLITTPNTSFDSNHQLILCSPTNLTPTNSVVNQQQSVAMDSATATAALLTSHHQPIVVVNAAVANSNPQSHQQQPMRHSFSAPFIDQQVIYQQQLQHQQQSVGPNSSNNASLNCLVMTTNGGNQLINAQNHLINNQLFTAVDPRQLTHQNSSSTVIDLLVHPSQVTTNPSSNGSGFSPSNNMMAQGREGAVHQALLDSGNNHQQEGADLGGNGQGSLARIESLWLKARRLQAYLDKIDRGESLFPSDMAALNNSTSAVNSDFVRAELDRVKVLCRLHVIDRLDVLKASSSAASTSSLASTTTSSRCEAFDVAMERDLLQSYLRRLGGTDSPDSTTPTKWFEHTPSPPISSSSNVNHLSLSRTAATSPKSNGESRPQSICQLGGDATGQLSRLVVAPDASQNPPRWLSSSFSMLPLAHSSTSTANPVNPHASQDQLITGHHIQPDQQWIVVGSSNGENASHNQHQQPVANDNAPMLVSTMPGYHNNNNDLLLTPPVSNGNSNNVLFDLYNHDDGDHMTPQLSSQSMITPRHDMTTPNIATHNNHDTSSAVVDDSCLMMELDDENHQGIVVEHTGSAMEHHQEDHSMDHHHHHDRSSSLVSEGRNDLTSQPPIIPQRHQPMTSSTGNIAVANETNNHQQSHEDNWLDVDAWLDSMEDVDHSQETTLGSYHQLLMLEQQQQSTAALSSSNNLTRSVAAGGEGVIRRPTSVVET